MASEESEFPRIFRGYDSEAVDRAMLRLRRELLAAKTEADRLTIIASELAEANESLKFEQEQSGNPSYAAFGHAFESILRDAQKHSDALINSARAEAFNLKNATERERAALVSNAREHSSRLLAHTEKRAAEILQSSLMQSAEILDSARAEASEIIMGAQVEVANARRNSTTEITRDKSIAKREVEKLQTAAEREIAELKLILTKNAPEIVAENISESILEVLRIDADAAAHRDEAEADYLRKHGEAVHTTELYLEQAQAELAALHSQVEQTQSKLDVLAQKTETDVHKLRQAVDARALNILADAAANAQQIALEGEQLANEITQRAQSQAQSILAAAHEERETLGALLASMRGVLTNPGSPPPVKTPPSRVPSAPVTKRKVTSAPQDSTDTVKAEVKPKTTRARASAASTPPK
jgi:hypothetical protein